MHFVGFSCQYSIEINQVSLRQQSSFICRSKTLRFIKLMNLMGAKQESLMQDTNVVMTVSWHEIHHQRCDQTLKVV